MAKAADAVEANWTAQHERSIAQPDVMLVRGVITGTALESLEASYPVEKPVESTPATKGIAAVGYCYCRKVHLELPFDLKPDISVICHCHDCREWHSVGSLPYMMFPLSPGEERSGEMLQVPLTLISGSEHLAYVHRTPEVRRWFAQCCGTRLFNTVVNEKLGLKLCGTFPTVFPEYYWVPTMHVNLREANDLAYPKLDDARWADLPGAFGGTGKHILA